MIPGKRFTVILSLTALLGACAPPELHYDAAANTRLSPEKAKAVVREILLNQPGGHAVQGVLINDEVLEVKKITTHGRSRRRDSTAEVTTVPLDGIGDIVLSRATIYYIVTIFDTNKAEQYRVYTSIESRARDFIDALQVLIRQSKHMHQ